MQSHKIKALRALYSSISITSVDIGCHIKSVLHAGDCSTSLGSACIRGPKASQLLMVRALSLPVVTYLMFHEYNQICIFIVRYNTTRDNLGIIYSYGSYSCINGVKFTQSYGIDSLSHLLLIFSLFVVD